MACGMRGSWPSPLNMLFCATTIRVACSLTTLLVHVGLPGSPDINRLAPHLQQDQAANADLGSAFITPQRVGGRSGSAAAGVIQASHKVAGKHVQSYKWYWLSL